MGTRPFPCTDPTTKVSKFGHQFSWRHLFSCAHSLPSSKRLLGSEQGIEMT
jgi:hypothetical protein